MIMISITLLIMIGILILIAFRVEEIAETLDEIKWEREDKEIGDKING